MAVIAASKTTEHAKKILTASIEDYNFMEMKSFPFFIDKTKLIRYYVTVVI